MKLIYWVAKRIDDSDDYSIRTKTKKECLTKLKEIGATIVKEGDETPYDTICYEPPKKVEVEYSSAFDLLEQTSNENRMNWEY